MAPAPRMAYEIIIVADAQEQLRQLRAYDHRIVLRAIENHLEHQPKQLSRSRIKKLSQPAISDYRLRVGEFRVYYDVEDSENRVVVLQVFEKGRRTTQSGDVR